MFKLLPCLALFLVAQLLEAPADAVAVKPAPTSTHSSRTSHISHHPGPPWKPTYPHTRPGSLSKRSNVVSSGSQWKSNTARAASIPKSRGFNNRPTASTSTSTSSPASSRQLGTGSASEDNGYGTVVTVSLARPFVLRFVSNLLATAAASKALQDSSSIALLLAKHQPSGKSMPPSLKTLSMYPDMKVEYLSSSLPEHRVSPLLHAMEVPESGKGVLLLEDDIIFAPNFARDLSDARKAILQQFGTNRYAINLYGAEAFFGTRPEVVAHQKAKGLVRGNWRGTPRVQEQGFSWGAQAMFFSAATRSDIAKYFREEVIAKNKYRSKGGDLAIKDALAHLHIKQFRIFGRSLVQHVGSVSSIGNAKRFHRSHDFPFAEEDIALDPPEMWAGGNVGEPCPKSRTGNQGKTSVAGGRKLMADGCN